MSDEGYGANDYIPTERPVVVVTGPGPGSGKLATCLSQVYHEHLRGNAAGYAKFETFPIWNLPLKHPVNVAYEAATVELQDVNLIDPFHLEAYGEQAVNYNRDVEAFPLVARILERIGGVASLPVADRHGRQPRRVRHRRRRGGARGRRAGGHPPVLPLRLRVRDGTGGPRGRRPRAADHEGTGPRRGAAGGGAARPARRPPRARPRARATRASSAAPPSSCPTATS